MGRAKLSKAESNKMTYERYRIALEFYGKELKPLKQPTAKSVTKAKTLWRKTQQELKKAGYTDLPTPTQVVSYVKEGVANEEDTNITHELDKIWSIIDSVEGKRRKKPSQRDWDQYYEAKGRLKIYFNQARQKLGDYEFLTALKSSDYAQRYESIIWATNYLDQETATIEGEAIPMILDIIESTLARWNI